MPRIHMILTEGQVAKLDKIAEKLGLELKPHHAATSGHRWNRTATIVHLIDWYERHEISNINTWKADA